MAQVLAPIVQTTGTITMLHSSSDGFQNTPAQQQQRSSQMPRASAYNVPSPGAGYRGTSAPIAPYAFSSTPQLRQENRSSSAPNAQQLTQPANPSKLGHPSHPSSSSDSTVSTSGSSNRSLATPAFAAKDDTAVRKSIVDDVAPSINFSTSSPDLSFSISESTFASDAPVKPSPGRYRRAASRTESTNSGTISPSTPTPTQQSPPAAASANSASPRPNLPPLSTMDLPPPARPTHNRASSVDDTQTARGGSIDQAKRYRRRSLSGLDANAMAASTVPTPPASVSPVIAPKRQTQEFRPGSSSSRHGSRPSSSQSHERQGSAGSTSSIGSNRPSSRQGSSTLRASPSSTSASKAQDNIRRMAPSPLSQPMSPSEPPSPAKKIEATAASAAVKQLTALNDKEGGKGMKSRLRRAFSFGSAAELRRASAENNIAAERAKLRKDRYNHEEDPEQTAIIAKQEAAGIGAGIYSGQGGFSGSNDNLSISSTASSASIMLRKMGTGMKKGSRSIKGLFRPKSVIGVPAADGPVRASVGQVSMVTVEAERLKVNVNADPHEQTGGGTGYPRLERNSIDAGRSTDVNSTSGAANDAFQRKSIIGSDKERAEVLSSIKKGILKRNGPGSGASSPVNRPADAPQLHESAKASAPSTPIQNNQESDYFTKPPRLANPSTRSLPTTPQGSLRNISFSPRIQFHDAWSASEYDRRGEIATCNRLTPMLAQQIKEELNSFKMEMEVHELSKPHTHFF